MSSHFKAVGALIEGGCDVNAKNNHGVTPLMLAAKTNQPETVQFLLDKRADVNATNVAGETALFVAAKLDPVAFASERVLKYPELA